MLWVFFLFFKKTFIWCGPFLKSFIEFVAILPQFSVLVFWILPSWPGMSLNPCTGRWSPNLWASREVPWVFPLRVTFSFPFPQPSFRPILCTCITTVLPPILSVPVTSVLGSTVRIISGKHLSSYHYPALEPIMASCYLQLQSQTPLAPKDFQCLTIPSHPAKAPIVPTGG